MAIARNIKESLMIWSNLILLFAKDKIPILGGKAIIKQNKFGVWQFRMWISGEKKYVENHYALKRKLTL